MNRRVKRSRAAELNLAPYAKEYLKRGWSVIPINPYTKKAATDWKEFQSRRMTETEADIYFSEGLNVGVVCGRVSNDLVGLDFDDLKLAKLWIASHPETLIFETGKGIRLLYTKQGGCATKHLKEKGLLVDILGEGSYTVMPPSWHGEKKKPYRWLNKLPILEYEGDFVEDLYALCSENEDYKKRLDAIDSFREQINIDALLKGVEEGGRDNAAIRVASWYRKGGLSAEDVLKKLREWNLNNKPPMSDNDIEAKVKSAFKPSKPYFFFTREPTSKDVEQIEVLTPEIEAFLENPNLMDDILNILDLLIHGERELKGLLLLCGLSSGLTDKPFGVIVIDVFGSGKSYTQRMVLTVFPKERVDQPTSMSYKVVNYLADDYQGRILRIDELFGMEEGMEYIRVWMTEGRLERWIVNPDTGKLEKKVTGGCPCFYTTTTKQVEEQYASRNWLGHIDTSRLQTIGIHHEQYVSDAFPEDFNAEQKNRTEFLTHVIRWLLQNSKPVLVPFRYSFSKDPRSRRERPKFQMLIKAICNLYQLQRKSVQFKNKTYLIAEIEDFEIALKIAEPFLRSTVMTLDKHALAVIDYLKTLGENERVTTKELLATIDIKHATLQRRLQYLERQGFVEFAAEPKRGTPTFYRLTEAGRNVSNVEIKITDDGQWIRDLYGKLDDPETYKLTNNAFSRILKEEEENEKQLAESQKRDKGLFVKKLREETENEKQAQQPQKYPGWPYEATETS